MHSPPMIFLVDYLILLIWFVMMVMFELYKLMTDLSIDRSISLASGVVLHSSQMPRDVTQ